MPRPTIKSAILNAKEEAEILLERDNAPMVRQRARNIIQHLEEALVLIEDD